MSSNELYNEEVPEITGAGADETETSLDLEFGAGASGEDDGLMLRDNTLELDDQADGTLDISAQPGAPELEQLTDDDLFGAIEQQPKPEVKATDDDPTKPADHLPRIEHDAETGSVRASIENEDGQHGQINAHLTPRGEDAELVIDDMNVARMHVDSDVPAWMLANLADASAAQGVRSVDSTVGSARALDIRTQVFGEGNLQFHDPGAKDGDTPLNVSVAQARAYLEPGDRTPLHVRGFLSTDPDRQLLADRFDQDEIAAQINPSAIEADEQTEANGVVEEVEVIADQAEADDAVEDDAAEVENQGAPATKPEIPEQPTSNSLEEDGEVSPDGRIVNVASFNAFHNSTSGFVKGALMRQHGLSPEEAEDVSQVAFARAWNNRERFDGENQRAWITRIAVNEAINRYRKDERGPRQVTDSEQLDTIFRTITSDEPLPDEIVATNDDTARMMQVLRDAVKQGDMPEHWPRILMMRYGLGMTEKEVAAELGIPQGTVASGGKRALARAQALMQPQSN